MTSIHFAGTSVRKPDANRVGVAIALGVALCPVSQAAAQCGRSYEPGLGTPPQAQGWIDRGTLQSVVAGELYIDSGANELNYFSDLESGTWAWSDGLMVEATVKIVSSGYGLNSVGGKRAGFSLAGTDSTFRYYGVGIGADRVYLTNDGAINPCCGFVELLFDSTDAFHTYTL